MSICYSENCIVVEFLYSLLDSIPDVTRVYMPSIWLIYCIPCDTSKHGIPKIKNLTFICQLICLIYKEKFKQNKTYIKITKLIKEKIVNTSKSPESL